MHSARSPCPADCGSGRWTQGLPSPAASPPATRCSAAGRQPGRPARDRQHPRLQRHAAEGGRQQDVPPGPGGHRQPGLRDQHGARCVLLGRGLPGQRNTGTRRSPGKVTGTQDWLDLGVGTNHACAITTANLAWCWGSNNHGELGDSTTTASTTPVPSAKGLTFLHIEAGALTSCGVLTDRAGRLLGQLHGRPATAQRPPRTTDAESRGPGRDAEVEQRVPELPRRLCPRHPRGGGVPPGIGAAGELERVNRHIRFSTRPSRRRLDPLPLHQPGLRVLLREWPTGGKAWCWVRRYRTVNWATVPKSGSSRPWQWRRRSQHQGAAGVIAVPRAPRKYGKTTDRRERSRVNGHTHKPLQFPWLFPWSSVFPWLSGGGEGHADPRRTCPSRKNPMSCRPARPAPGPPSPRRSRYRTCSRGRRSRPRSRSPDGRGGGPG